METQAYAPTTTTNVLKTLFWLCPSRPRDSRPPLGSTHVSHFVIDLRLGWAFIHNIDKWKRVFQNITYTHVYGKQIINPEFSFYFKLKEDHKHKSSGLLYN
jgi:hypothetical protein